MKRFLLCLSLGCMVCLTGVQNGYADAGWKMPGVARDAAISYSESGVTVWMIESIPSRWVWNAACEWIPETQRWKRFSIAGEHITADQNGIAWVVNHDGQYYRWSLSNKKFNPVNTGVLRPAKDIAIGPCSGPAPYFIWAIDRNDNQLYKWQGGASWPMLEFPAHLGIAARIDIDRFDRPWIVTEAGIIYFWDDVNFQWKNYSVTVKNGRRYTMYATDISIDLNGWEVWITTKATRPEAGRLYYTMIPDPAADPIPPAYWYMGPDTKGTRLDVFDGEIIVVKSTGEIWWVSLE